VFVELFVLKVIFTLSATARKEKITFSLIGFGYTYNVVVSLCSKYVDFFAFSVSKLL
jgi:hypothetical protein